MKTLLQISQVVLITGMALGLTGCLNHPLRSSRLVRSGNDFEVVETSTKRLLTPKEMAQLRVSVERYLEQEGAIASGDYFVKVYLTAEQDGVPGEWVVVRFTRESDLRYSLLASYPEAGPGSASYVSYNYYPYGYDSFSRLSLRTYDDYYYGSGYYFPRTTVSQRPRSRNENNRDRDQNHNGDRDRRDDGNGRRDDTTDRGQSPRHRNSGQDVSDNSYGRERQRDQRTNPPAVSPAAVSREQSRSGGNPRIRESQTGSRNPVPRHERNQTDSQAGDYRSSRTTGSGSQDMNRSEPSPGRNRSEPTFSAPTSHYESTSDSGSSRETNGGTREQRLRSRLE